MKLVGLLAVFLVAVSLPGGGARPVSCAGPSLSIDGLVVETVEPTSRTDPVVPAGLPLVVQGRGFVDGCDDTGTSSGPGCSAQPVDTERPQQDVTLTIRQGGESWVLGTLDAGTAADGQLGRITWQADAPAALRPGRAELVAGTARLPVQVTRDVAHPDTAASPNRRTD